MKFGVRKPSIKKRIKAKTTGRVKKAAKRTVNPLYGKKGMGLVNNPKKALYNKVYNSTTIGVSDFLESSSKNENTIRNNRKSNNAQSKEFLSDSNIKSAKPKSSNVPLYEITNDNKAKIGKRIYTKKQLKKYSILLLVFSITYMIIGIYFFPFFIIGLFLLWASHTYHKISKLLK